VHLSTLNSTDNTDLWNVDRMQKRGSLGHRVNRYFAIYIQAITQALWPGRYGVMGVNKIGYRLRTNTIKISRRRIIIPGLIIFFLLAMTCPHKVYQLLS
jgi:hypothetical protein